MKPIPYLVALLAAFARLFKTRHPHRQWLAVVHWRWVMLVLAGLIGLGLIPSAMAQPRLPPALTEAGQSGPTYGGSFWVGPNHPNIPRVETLVLDTVTNAPGFSYTGSTPRTYMGGPFNAANPGGPLQISSAELYMVSAATQTFANGLCLRLQFWENFNGGSSPVFSMPVGGVQSFTIPGPISLVADAYYIMTATFASPLTFADLTNNGFAVNYQGNSGAGCADTDDLTSLVRYVDEPAEAPIAVGNIPLAPPDLGYYRNASGFTNFNFNSTDLRAFLGTNSNAVAIKLYASLTLTTITPTLTVTVTTSTPTDTPTITPTNTPGSSLTPTATPTRTPSAPRLYLPIMFHRWPPIPDTPVLNPINNSDGDGNYTVSWGAAFLADTYTLEEDDNPTFSSPATVYTGAGVVWNASGKSVGTYHYRVRATNIWGSSGWSATQSVSVLPPSTFYSIADTSVRQGSSTVNYGIASSMYTGYDNTNCRYLGSPAHRIGRSLVKFNLSSVPANTPIRQATLYVRLVSYCLTWSTGTPGTTVTAYRTSAGWSETSVTWDTQPGWAEGYGSVNIETGSPGLRWYAIDVTDLVHDWVNGTFPNDGLTLIGPESFGTATARYGFATREWSGYTPYLSLAYTSLTNATPQPILNATVDSPVCWALAKGGEVCRSSANPPITHLQHEQRRVVPK